MAVRSYNPDTNFWYVCTMTLAFEVWLGHDSPLGHGQQLCEILSRSNLELRSNVLGMLCTVTLTLEIWPWVKVVTHPWVMDNNCVKYYPDTTWQWEVMAWTRILGMCALCHLGLGDMTLGQGHETPLGHGQQLIDTLTRSDKGVWSYGSDTDVNRQTDRRGGV